MWCSIRDITSLLDRCVSDDEVIYETFYAVSDNERA